MSTATAATAVTTTTFLRPLRAILAAGLICGTLDGLSALALSSGHFVRLFQAIAFALLGPSSFQGGAATVALGVAIHYSVALTAAAVYFAASRALPILLARALPFGILYGVCVHLVMQFVVLPMTAIGRRPFNPRGFLIGLAIHMVIVGPSIALSLRRFPR